MKIIGKRVNRLHIYTAMRNKVRGGISLISTLHWARATCCIYMPTGRSFGCDRLACHNSTRYELPSSNLLPLHFLPPVHRVTD